MKRSLKWTLIAVPTVLVVAAATAFAADAPPFGSDEIQGADRDRAVEAAIAHVGGGTAISTEDRDEDSPYEVEVRTDNGSIVDVDLDDSFRVIGTDSDDDRYDDDNGTGGTSSNGKLNTVDDSRKFTPHRVSIHSSSTSWLRSTTTPVPSSRSDQRTHA